MHSDRRVRKLTIVAQDPSVKAGRGILTARVEVPAEDLDAGPWGHRVQVIDYDASSRQLFAPLDLPAMVDGDDGDPFAGAGTSELLENPGFHAQNVYAVVMRTLARFESALGRRVDWGFTGHQIKVAPHAFSEANAFYSKGDGALMFGYFPSQSGRTVFTCLSHDVVAHETAHALVDGIRSHFIDPSSPDQAAFHEGFADIVALLSMFALPEVVEHALREGEREMGRRRRARSVETIDRSLLHPTRLRRLLLFGLAEQFGSEIEGVRGSALRRSVEILPNRGLLDTPEYMESHRRGEILVAAVMNAFITVWSQRALRLGDVGGGAVDLGRVIEDGADTADYLLTMAIRALDYTPASHLEFCDFLSALLTADYELRPNEKRYEFRRLLRESFGAYGIPPATRSRNPEPGLWAVEDGRGYSYDDVHVDSLQRDPVEVFRFIWRNRKKLDLCEGAYSHVYSVRPCVRVGPDGFVLNETVAEFRQILDLNASELGTFGISAPEGMPPDQSVSLQGGGTLIFDEFGHLKYNVHNRLLNKERQSRRLAHLWRYGHFEKRGRGARRFAELHRLRSRNASLHITEGW